MCTAIVTIPKATLYENPAKETVSDELLSGWLVTVEQERGRFLKITTDYGYPGWLERSTVNRIFPDTSDYSKSSSSSAAADKRFALVGRKTIDLLKEPKVQAPVLTTLFMGSRVIMCEESVHGWQNIKTASGICGYVPSVALLPIRENFSFSNFHNTADGKNCNESQIRSDILNYALSFLGTQYRWGGKTCAGIDCSGLTFMSYYMCGIIIYRDAAIKEGFLVHEIPFSRIKPADLLYFPGHIALYLGNGRYIHSTGNLQNFGCVINSLCPEDADYRADLAKNILAVGSVF